MCCSKKGVKLKNRKCKLESSNLDKRIEKGKIGIGNRVVPFINLQTIYTQRDRNQELGIRNHGSRNQESKNQ